VITFLAIISSPLQPTFPPRRLPVFSAANKINLFTCHPPVWCYPGWYTPWWCYWFCYYIIYHNESKFEDRL